MATFIRERKALEKGKIEKKNLKNLIVPQQRVSIASGNAESNVYPKEKSVGGIVAISYFN